MYHDLARGIPYTAPSVKFALWPSGATLLAVLFYLDAAIAAIPAIRVVVRSCSNRLSDITTHITDPADEPASVLAPVGSWLLWPSRRYFWLLLGSCLLSTMASLVLIWQARQNWALTLIGCNFPVALNTVLACGLFAHALIFAALSAVHLTHLLDRIAKQHWCCWLCDDVKQLAEQHAVKRRKWRGRIFGYLAVIFLLGTILVIFFMAKDTSDSQRRTAQPTDSSALGWGDWVRPHWAGTCLSFFLLVWSIVLFRAALRVLRWRLAAVRTPVADGGQAKAKGTVLVRFAVLGASAMHLSGWIVITLSGFPHVFAPAFARFVLGLTLIVASIHPFLLALLLLRPRVLWLVVCQACRRRTRPPRAGAEQTKMETCALCISYWVLSVAMLSTGVLLLIFGKISTSFYGIGWDADGIGRPRWSPSAAAVVLCLLTIIWSALLVGTSISARVRRPIGPLLGFNAPGFQHKIHGKLLQDIYGTLAFYLGTTTALIGMAVPVLSGFNLIDDKASRLALGTCLLVSMAMPLGLIYVTISGQPIGGLLFRTEYYQLHKATTVLFQTLIATFLVVGAFNAFLITAIESTTLCCAILWLLDACCLGLVVSVVASRKSCGIVRPLFQTSAGTVMIAHDGLTSFETRSMLTFCMAGVVALVAGVTSLTLSMWEVARDVVFGVDGANQGVGLTMVCHSPIVILTGRVFQRSRPWFIFQPTEMSKASPHHFGIAMYVLGLSLLAGGLAIIDFFQGGSTSYEPPPPPPPTDDPHAHTGLAAPDELTSALCALLVFDALVLFCAASVQASGRKWRLFCPLTSHRQHPLVAPALGGVATLFFLSAILLAWLSFMSLAEYLWRDRALPTLVEIVLAAHVAALHIAMQQMWAIRNGKAADRAAPSVLGIFTIGRSFMGWFYACTILAVAAGGGVFALPFTNGPMRREQSQYAAPLELLAGLLSVVGFSLAFSFGRSYRTDLSTTPILKAHNVMRQRRVYIVCGVLCNLLAAGSYAAALVPRGSLSSSGASLMLSVAVFGLLHVPLLTSLADVNASGVAAFGLAPHSRRFDLASGTVRTRRDLPVGFALFVTACLVSVISGALLVTTVVGVDRDNNIDTIVSSLAHEASPNDAEACTVVFGIESTLRSARGATPQMSWLNGDGQQYWLGLSEGFHPETPSAQEEMRLFCEALTWQETSVMNSQSGGYDCIMRELHVYATRHGLSWPISPEQFAPALYEMVTVESPYLRPYVGFRAEESSHGYPANESAMPREIAWLKVVFKSK